MDDLIREFLLESYENLDRLDQEFVKLETEPGNLELLKSIFRTIHTIKGTCGFLGFTKLEKLAHAGENLLSVLRDGQLTLNAEITTALLAMVDAVREMLRSIDSTGNEGERKDEELIATLARLLQPEVQAKPDPAAEQGKTAENSEELHPDTNIGEILIRKKNAKVIDVYDAVKQQEEGDPRRVGEILVEKGVVKPQDVLEALNLQQQARGSSASDSTIRVDVSQLDRLMNRVGELVLLRDQILQFTNTTEDSGLVATSQRLNLITTELQEGVMKTRMQPIGNIWSKFPRTVRDVAVSCGKRVRIEMEGKETELDKTIIEAIKDPLMHIVRNSVDHGIETPEERIAAGKAAEGRLLLRAYHEGGQVNIEISDDGAGVNYEKIRSKAIQKGLITSDQAARMTEREMTNLIFLPGFSTAETVTNVSGRGVGLDVVRTNIEKIGGTVDLQSKTGQGSVIRMKIPLTLAIIPALIVTTGADRYAIPQVNLLELVRLEREQAINGIELVNGAPVYRLRGRLLPLVFLNRELQIVANPERRESGQAPAGRKTLDFDRSRSNHQRWLKTLQQVLDGQLAMAADQADPAQQGALGEWLYSFALKEYGASSEIRALEETHKEFHALVREVLALKERGDSARAVQVFARVEQSLEKLMQLLTAVESKELELQNVNIVVLQADDRQFGLVVDEINDTEEIVVKPLSKQLKSVNAYAGATIMGDGKVALILDVMGLAQRASVVSEVRERVVTEKQRDETDKTGQENHSNAVLLFQSGDNGRMAIDLSLLARLEEFPRDTVEFAGDQEVVQYRGNIMPLVRVSEVLQNKRRNVAENAQDSLHVVVYASQGHSVGLAVDRILDIVEESFAIQRQADRKGVLGSAVIQKRVTDILDVPGLIAAAEGAVLPEEAPVPA
ncbi:MAG: chemotaxis protein CheW [Candidatus Acidiferrum sp.]